MTRVYVDLETRSSVPITSGAYKYAESPDFRVLVWAWAINDGAVETSNDPEMPQELIDALADDSAVIVAHNAQFERVCMSYERAPEASEFLSPEKFDDTMARASIHGLPAGLDNLAKALGVPISKDSAGTQLINKFSVPPFVEPEDAPESFEAYTRYCAQDVKVLRKVDKALPGWPGNEYAVWCLDQKINDRGIQVDLHLARACVDAAATNRIVDEIAVMHATGITNPGSRDQMLAWLRGRPGLEDLADLQAETVENLLEDPDIDDTTRHVLQRRQDLAPASLKKHDAMIAWAGSDSRVRGLFHYAAAHTGRWGGRGPQFQNQVRDHFESEEQQVEAIEHVKSGGHVDTKTLKKLIRPCWVGPFTVVDYSAIEARVLAWLAGEQWAIDAFKNGRDIYVETAERASTATRTYTRQEGKVMTLALGYRGALGAMRKMGAEGDDDDELLTQVRAWREANPNIVEFWNDLEHKMTSGKGGPVGPGRVHTRRAATKSRTINAALIAPNGTRMVYRNLKQEKVLKTNYKTGLEEMQLAWRFTDYRRGPGTRTATYSGKLTENLVQKVARDLLAEALVRLDREGYPVVGHVHDEVVIEGEHDIDTIAEIMCELPDWAGGLPMAAEGFHCDRYQKG